jgi:hypothetical protein
MQLGGDALRFVLAQGLPALIDVTGRSMEPTILLGEKVNVVGLRAGDALGVGDVVLIATSDADVRVLHRVLAVFADGGGGLVHQGDAPGSTFGICARADVLARVLDFGVDRLNAEARTRFRRRCLAAETYVRARRVARALGVADLAAVRRCGQVFRKLSRSLVR